MKVNCPSCKRPLVIPDKRRGLKAKCPCCAVRFTVPDAAAEVAVVPASRLPLVLALGGVAVALLLGGGLVVGLVVAALQVNAPPEPMVARVATEPAPPLPSEQKRVEPTKPQPTGPGEAQPNSSGSTPPEQKRVEPTQPQPTGPGEAQPNSSGSTPPAPPLPPEQKRVEPTQPQPTGPGEAQPNPNSRLPQVTFLESKATAKRVVFLVDCSSSMGSSFEHVKKELTHSLQGLGAEQHFAVIFFNKEAHQMPHPGWLRGRAGVAKILPWIKGFHPDGGTDPRPAFEQAFRLEPRPDVIFFMTDGLLPYYVIPSVSALISREPKVKINSIQFQQSFLSKAELAKMAKRFKDDPVALAELRKSIMNNPAVPAKWKKRLKYESKVLATLEILLAAFEDAASEQLRRLARQSGGAFSIYTIGAPAAPGVPGSTPPWRKKKK